MKTSFTKTYVWRGIAIVLFILSGIQVFTQTVPEFMYFKFDASGNQQNYASAPVGTNPATLTGLTTGSTGQFNTALIGNGLTSTSNRLSTGWITLLPNTGWTISFWLNNFPATSSTTYYYFGDASAGSFRCFTGGVAPAGGLLLRGTGLTDVPITAIPSTPTVIHLVYTGTAIRVFKNGVFSSTVAQNSVAITGTTGPFLVGGYSSSNSMNAGTLMDEFRLYNRALSDVEVGQTWNQPLPLATGPTVVTTAATAVTNTTATLNGTVNANNSSTTVTFEYGLTTSYGTTVPGVPGTVTGNTVTLVNAPITSLLPNTLYHYRIVGVNATGTSNGSDMTFTTTPDPPTVVTTAATSIALNGATLNGTVNANNASTAVTFQYGLTTAYGSTATATPSPVTGSSVTSVSAAIAGLTPNTLYHFRVVGTNTGGTSNGNDLTFTTAGPPVVVTNPASNIGVASAQLNGTVTANNLSTTVSFDWGLTTAYGNTVAATPSPVTGNLPTAVLANIAGLTTGQTYHFRCVGVNAAGTANGLDQLFVAGCQMPVAAGAITGPNGVCSNSSEKIYTVGAITNATSYTWTVPAGASITAGAGTTSITVTFGATSGNVTVMGTNACGSGTPSSLAVTVNPLPVPTINGPATACQGSTGNTYATQTGMTGYTWTVSPGGTITAGAGTNSITVTWGTAGAQNVSVTYTNASGCSPAAPVSYPVTVNTAPSPTVTGPNSLCVNSGYYNYITEAGQTGYVWTISSGGTITFGQGTNQVQVLWNTSGAQTISVNYTNANGCAASVPTSFAVTVNPMPNAAGNITGTANVCLGAMGIPYSVAPITNAISYIWTLPAGATIASGSGTNSITVNYSSSAVSGAITVYGNNLCGNGSVSPPFNVNVSQIPAAAGTITGETAVCQSTTGVAYTVPVIAYATTYAWTLPAGATVASGAGTNSITVDFADDATSGDITVYGSNYCGNGTVSAPLTVTLNPVPETPVIALYGGTLYSNAPSGNQWYFEGNPIAGATGVTYVPEVTGVYYTVVTLIGCSSAHSEPIYVVITGVDELKGTGISISPVPNDGRFTVSINDPQENSYSIVVYNNIGVKVFETRDIAVKGNTQKVVDLRPAPGGVYSVIIQSHDNKVIKKIIVNR